MEKQDVKTLGKKKKKKRLRGTESPWRQKNGKNFKYLGGTPKH